VFYDLLIQRFNNLTSKEIHQMIEFRDLETTVLGKDLIAIGAKRGREEGITFVLLRQISRRFGALPVATADRIHDLDYLQLEQLADAILDFANMADLEAWLAALPAKAVR
jgi:hypothetical protein